MGPFSEKRNNIEKTLGEVFRKFPPYPEYLKLEWKKHWHLYWLLIHFRNRCADEDQSQNLRRTY